jgi:hypothetical protein
MESVRMVSRRSFLGIRVLSVKLMMLSLRTLMLLLLSRIRFSFILLGSYGVCLPSLPAIHERGVESPSD